MKKSTIVRVLLALICLAIQISVAYLLYIVIDADQLAMLFFAIFCLYFILKIIKESRNHSFTLPWIIIFAIFPIPGALLYFIISLTMKTSKLLKRVLKEEKSSKKYLIQDPNIKKKFKDNTNLRYISDFAKYPVTTNNDIEYYPLGDIGYESMLKEIKKAKKFIFMEYFIFEEGKMWNSILEVLEEKVKKGVEVRIIYDDFGCLTKLENKYYKKLEAKGIKCVVFNKIKPFAGVIMNNRDHRKILVIDGKVAFSGGINIADEYINVGSKFGHWKDNAIKVSGDAVWNYTVMFLTLWNSFNKEDKDFKKYKYEHKTTKDKGFVTPYGTNPLTGEVIGEDVYLNIINSAKEYIHILTPYLIVDSDIANALVLAAKKGVDVRVVIPAIPDKKLVYSVSESYAELLIKGGVKVYKYKPGFVHSKLLVSDNEKATVGTINMDYRSLYLHFECACYIESHKVIKDIKKDVDETIKKCHLLTKKDVFKGHFKSFWQSVLRLFSPLM